MQRLERIYISNSLWGSHFYSSGHARYELIAAALVALLLLFIFHALTRSFFNFFVIYRYAGKARKVDTPGGGIQLSAGSYDNLAMNGNEVYKFATRQVPKVIKEALVAADMEVEDVDWLLLHQVSSTRLLRYSGI